MPLVHRRLFPRSGASTNNWGTVGANPCAPESQTRHHQTNLGLCLLRQAEIERLHGHTLLNRHFATALQMLGQGV